MMILINGKHDHPVHSLRQQTFASSLSIGIAMTTVTFPWRLPSKVTWPRDSVQEFLLYWLLIKDRSYLYMFSVCNISPATWRVNGASFATDSPVCLSTNEIAYDNYGSEANLLPDTDRTEAVAQSRVLARHSSPSLELFGVLNELRPVFITLQDGLVANADEESFSSSERHIETFWILEETETP